MTKIADDFAAIQQRLAELEGKPPAPKTAKTGKKLSTVRCLRCNDTRMIGNYLGQTQKCPYCPSDDEEEV